MGLIVLLLLVVFIVQQFRSVSLRISKQTTCITKPLTSDGAQVDFFSAIEHEAYPDNIATNQNGYRLILNYLGAPPRFPTKYFDQLCTKLELSPPAGQRQMSFQEPFHFLLDYVKGQDFDETLVKKPSMRLTRDELTSGNPPVAVGLLEEQLWRPWTLEEFPMMEEWLTQNGAALDLLDQASRRSTFYIPMLRDTEGAPLFRAVMGPQLNRWNEFSRALMARAYYYIGIGDIDNAITDIITCKRLGRLVGTTMREGGVGVALEGVSDGIGVSIALRHPPKKEQLIRFLQEIEALPPMTDVRSIMRYEHYAALSYVQTLSAGCESLTDVPGLSPAISDYFEILGTNWNVVAKRLNKDVELILSSGSEPAQMSIDPISLMLTSRRSQIVGNRMARSVFLTRVAALERVQCGQCRTQMKRIILAMLIYQCDNGTLPPAYTVDEKGVSLHSWRVLLLPYLGHQNLYDKIRLEEPWDSRHNAQFHRQPLDVYRCPSYRSAEGGHATYSVLVGPNSPFGRRSGKPLSKFGPRRDRVILLVERPVPVCWMMPTKDIFQAAVLTSEDSNALQRVVAHPHSGRANYGDSSGAIFSRIQLNDPAITDKPSSRH